MGELIGPISEAGMSNVEEVESHQDMGSGNSEIEEQKSEACKYVNQNLKYTPVFRAQQSEDGMVTRMKVAMNYNDPLMDSFRLEAVGRAA